MNIKKILLGITIVLFAILLNLCSYGIEPFCLATGGIGLLCSTLGALSK